MYHSKRKRRKKNPIGNMATFGVIGGLALAGFLAYDLSKGSDKKPSSCAPFKWDEAGTRQAIEARLDAGIRDPAQIAIEVSVAKYGTYPGTGAEVAYPPTASSPKGVACIWEKVMLLIGIIYDERGIDPDEDESTDIVPIDPINDLKGYPWNTPGVDPNGYPTPGLFADVGDSRSFNYSRGLSEMSEAALNSALAMAASLGHDVSFAQATMKVEGQKKIALVNAMRELLECSKFNDGLYGVDASAEATYSDMPNYLFGGTNKRTVLYLPQHNDNLRLMKLGKSPKRAIRLNGSHISGQGRRQPQLWIPGINLEALAGQYPTVTVEGMAYKDGSSTLEPPPSVQRLGVDMSGVALPGGAGC